MSSRNGKSPTRRKSLALRRAIDECVFVSFSLVRFHVILCFLTHANVKSKKKLVKRAKH